MLLQAVGGHVYPRYISRILQRKGNICCNGSHWSLGFHINPHNCPPVSFTQRLGDDREHLYWSKGILELFELDKHCYWPSSRAHAFGNGMEVTACEKTESGDSQLFQYQISVSLPGNYISNTI